MFRFPDFRTKSLCAALLFAVLLCSRPVIAADSGQSGVPDTVARLAAALRTQVAKTDLSVIIGVGQIGQEPHFQEHGSFAADSLLPEETLVDLGSNTKAVTAAVVLKHVERGTFGLDDTLDTLLDAVPEDKQTITLRQLLTHRAGLPDAVGSDEERIGKEAYLKRVFATPLQNQPGTTYAYSNVGYALLAAILEEKTGSSFEPLLASTLFPGAEVPDIGYELTYREEASAISGRIWLTLYQRLPIRRASWGGRSVGWNLLGNGGAVATPFNAMKFYENLVTGQIVDLALLEEGFIHEGVIPAPKSYGFGIVRLEGEDGTVFYGHSGANIVFSVDWRFYPTTGVMIFIAGLQDEASEAMSVAVEQLGML